MHVNRALLQTFPDFFRRIKSAGNVGRDESDNSKLYWQQKSCSQSKHTTRNRGGDPGFPLINGVVVVVDFNFTRDDFWEREVAPAPELRRGRAGHARDGRARAIMLDGDFLPFGCRQRRAADGAITFAAQQGTRVLRIGVLGRLEFVREALRQFFHVGAAERGDGNFFLRGINRHRLERRLLAQRVHDGARQAFGGLAFGLGGWRRTHVVEILAQRKNGRDGKIRLATPV
jgi:hypothetical protein